MSEEKQKFDLKKDKVYVVYLAGGRGTVVGQYLDYNDYEGGILINFKNVDDGWATQKKFILNPTYISHMVEFDTKEEYQRHYNAWKEEEKSNKFKNE